MKNLYKFISLLCLVFFLSIPGESSISSVILNPATPTPLSTGLSYYLAGYTYNFTVNVIDPAATGWANFTNVSIMIPNTPNITVSINPSLGAPSMATTVVNGPVNASAAYVGNFNNFTVTFTLVFRWDTAASAWAAARGVIASATSTTLPNPNTRTHTVNVSYGVCSTIRVHNLSQDTVAADGYINQYHSNFNVTGTLIYNVPGAGAADTVPGGYITGTTLCVDNNAGATTITNGATNNLSYTVTSATAMTFGAHTWYVRVDGPNAPAGGLLSANGLGIYLDEVEVTDVEVVAGNGIAISGAPNRVEYRSFNIPGTQLRVHARMRNSLSNVIGNTTVRIRDIVDGLDHDVVIPDGSAYGTLAIANPTTPGSGVTLPFHNYRATNVFGGVTDSEQNLYGLIRQPGNVLAGTNTIIYWENADPPGTNTGDFNTAPTFFPTAGSLRFDWTAIANAHPDLDFDTYKVYFRIQGSTPWSIVDRNTATFGTLGTIATNTVLINGLQPLTVYEYMITSVDIFGNETQTPNIYLGTTSPSSITVKVTDSITSYDIPGGITEPDPAISYKLLKSNIRIDNEIVTSGNRPEKVEILVADNTTDVAGQWGTGLIDDLRLGTFYALPTTSTGPNTWTGYIPTGNPLMATGTNIRFILRIYYSSGIVDVDRDSPGAGDPTNHEWRINIYSEPVFTPWPTRILNNVITDKNPVAYPAYYLTDDAYVTITAYDIKGRVVSILLQDAYRKAGQNIKENGWRGTNKSNRKLGLGLYYVHIKAKRASDGKLIIDKFNKVVMAK